MHISFAEDDLFAFIIKMPTMHRPTPTWWGFQSSQARCWKFLTALKASRSDLASCTEKFVVCCTPMPAIPCDAPYNLLRDLSMYWQWSIKALLTKSSFNWRRCLPVTLGQPFCAGPRKKSARKQVSRPLSHGQCAG